MCVGVRDHRGFHPQGPPWLPSPWGLFCAPPPPGQEIRDSLLGLARDVSRTNRSCLRAYIFYVKVGERYRYVVRCYLLSMT